MSQNNIRLISAGAGTGKTYKLTDEFAALLTGDKKYEPSQIIATTFTRAAAGELKSRIKEKILDHGLMELAPHLDQAVVGTVNGVCQQLLTFFSFEAGLSPALAVTDDDEKNVLFQTAISGSLDIIMLNELDEIADRFSLERKDVLNVIKSISDNARNNKLGKKELELSRDDSVKSLQSVLPKANADQHKTQLRLKTLIPALKQKCIDEKDDTNDTNATRDNFESFEYNLRQGLVIPWAKWAALSTLKCGAKSKRAKVFDNACELARQHMQFPEFQSDLVRYITLCFDAAIISLERYATLKKERGLVDFVDQESLLLNALDDKKIQKRFTEKFKVLLVDEFQDTSPLQLSLFLKMSSLVEKVIWVGDSKQAIYGFRNSDAQLINTVTTALGKPHADDILPTSFRSRPELVDIVNRLFLPAFIDTEKVLTKEQIVLSAHRDKNEQLQTAFQLWGFEWQRASGKKDNNEKYQSHLAARIATFLAAKPLLEDRDTNAAREVKAGDICILCRTNINCIGIANALRSQGLQAVVSNFGLNLTAEWRLLKACLHLLVDANDSLSKFEIEFLTNPDHDVPAMLEARLLFLEQAGDDYKTKNNWLSGHPVIEWIDTNRNFLLAESISGIIRMVFSGLDINRVVMQFGNGAQRLANLQQILTYSTEFEGYCLKLALLPNVHGFISWFDSLSANEQDKRGLVSNEFSVNISTYHAAKGLEWPVVILCDLDAEREPDVFSIRVNAKGTINFKDPLKDRSLRFWPWPYTTSPYGKKSGFEPFKTLFTDSEDYQTLFIKAQTEALRLLYVGFTRPRDYLVIPFKVKSQECYLKTIADNGILSFIDLDNVSKDLVFPKSKLVDQPLRLWVTGYTDVAEEVNTTHKQAEVYLRKEREDYLPYHITPSSSEPDKQVSFKEGVQIHNSFSDDKIAGEKSAFGTFIHRMFCAYTVGMSNDKLGVLINRLGICYGFENRKLHNELLTLVPEFYKWIQTKFNPLKIYKEVPLMQEKDGQLINGIADLLIETETEVILIDYKTFIGTSLEMQWKAGTFSGQLTLYMDILEVNFPGKKVRGAIYFVMKGVMVWME